MDNIIALAHEAQFEGFGNGDWVCTTEEIARLAKLVEERTHTNNKARWFQEGVESEREACEALHDHDDVLAPVGQSAWGEAYQDGWIAGTEAYRAAIRARGEMV